jgi:hypothetical protein
MSWIRTLVLTNFIDIHRYSSFQVPVSSDKSSRGYYLRNSDDETYFPGRAAEIVAYGQVGFPRDWPDPK